MLEVSVRIQHGCSSSRRDGLALRACGLRTVLYRKGGRKQQDRLPYLWRTVAKDQDVSNDHRVGD